jgi:ribosomal protein S18 acetylase RimI-like enzyme
MLLYFSNYKDEPMFIVRATAVTDELMEAVTRLMPQLKLKYSLPTREELGALVGSKASILLIVRFPNENGPIVGMLTLLIYRVPSGVRAHVEDIVVDESMRGQGIGEALVRRALNIAREAGANGVALTTNPRREAANRLYQRMGFNRWETNVYFYEF